MIRATLKDGVGLAAQFLMSSAIVYWLAMSVFTLQDNVDRGDESAQLVRPLYDVIPSEDGTGYYALGINHTIVAGDISGVGGLFFLEPDGARPVCLARSPADGRVLIGSVEGDVYWLGRDAGRAMQPLAALPSVVSSVAVSPDGKQVAATSLCGQVGVWDARSGRGAIWRVTEETTSTWVQFVGDGDCLAVSITNGAIDLWSISEQKLIGRLPAQTNSLTCICSVPRTPFLACTGLSGNCKHVRLWNVQTGGEVWTAVIEGSEPDRWYPTHLAASPDGRFLAFGCESKLLVLDVATGRRIAETEVAGMAITSVAYLPDGSGLVSTGREGCVRHWDPQTLAERWSIPVLQTAQVDSP